MAEIIFTFTGIIGAVLTLIAYIMLEKDVLTSHQPAYLWLNLIGSSTILASVFYNWNSAIFTIEVAWIGISLYGFFKIYKKRKSLTAGVKKHRKKA